MVPSASQRAAYREVLKPAVQAVKDYRGTEASADNVLRKAIEAENWIKANFPDRQACDVELELISGAGKKTLPSFNQLLGRCLERLQRLFRRIQSVKDKKIN